MRRAILLLPALAALAACSVELEGAACDTPGNTDQCPAGQKCGNDHRCSVAAADPACGFCEIGTTQCNGTTKVQSCAKVDDVCSRWNEVTCTGDERCLGSAGAFSCAVPEGNDCAVPGTKDVCPTGQLCGMNKKCSKRANEPTCFFCKENDQDCNGPGNARRKCAFVDVACNGWTADACATGLLCSPSGSNASCICPAPGQTFGVDAERSGTLGVTPSGAAAPAGCRAADLQTALNAAGALAPTAATVIVFAKSAGTTTVPLTATLTVPSNVMLTSDAPTPLPASYVLQAASGSSDLVHLEGGGKIQGFTVKSTGATGASLKIVCGGQAGATAQLNAVVVDGGQVAGGVVVSSGCPLTASGLEISRATGAGLLVATGDVAVGAAVTGVSFHDNAGAGAQVTSGRMTLSGSATAASVTNNGGSGVRIEGAQVDATVEDLTVSTNGAVGLLVKDVGGAAVRVRRAVVAKNLSTVYGAAPNTRNAGGVLFSSFSAPATLEFQANTVCAHPADEVAFYSDATWNVAGASACTAPTRVYDASGGKMVVSTGGAVDARYISWNLAPQDPLWFTGPVTYEPSCAKVDTVTLPDACK